MYIIRYVHHQLCISSTMYIIQYVYHPLRTSPNSRLKYRPSSILAYYCNNEKLRICIVATIYMYMYIYIYMAVSISVRNKQVTIRVILCKYKKKPDI
jgi:hypothetical protein